MKKKVKILFISHIPPIPTQGSAMTFYRHFVNQKEFEIAVITDDQRIKSFETQFRYITVNVGKLGNRLKNTRLHNIIQSLRLIFGIKRLHPKIVEFTIRFQPDAIFTVGGSWSWMAIIAKRTADKFKIPLITSFNDWWHYGIKYHSLTHQLLERRFYNFYQNSSLAICTSEGMRKKLGPHKNTLVSYPTGAKRLETESKIQSQTINKTFTIGFGGNLGDWYGKMIEAVVNETPEINYKLFGFNPSWSKKFDNLVKKRGFYYGQVPFETLEKELQTCDALLLLMGFGKEVEIIESTSFKTKFLDYLAIQKPIILWGPLYCSAVETAKAFDSAEICTDNSPNAIKKVILKLKDNTSRQKQLTFNANEMYKDKFHPDIIQEKLVNKILKTVEDFNRKR